MYSLLCCVCISLSIGRASALIGMSKAYIMDFPYQAAVLSDYKHICSGAVVSHLYVVTTARCVRTTGVKGVRVGSSYHHSGGLQLLAAEVYIHPKFNASNFDWDIALLKLEDSLPLGSHVAIVDLSEQNIEMTVDISEQNEEMITYANFTAWGFNQNSILNTELGRIKLNIPEMCNETYDQYLITPQMFCTKGRSVSSYDCGHTEQDHERYYYEPTEQNHERYYYGHTEGYHERYYYGPTEQDHGGPLVKNGVLYGLYSWGDTRMDNSKPAVFTNIASSREWILDILND